MSWISKLFGWREVKEPLDPSSTDHLLTEPNADFRYVDGKLQIVSYNKAFVDQLRSNFGDLVSDTDSDDFVVNLYVDRENISREDPKLEIVHSGIEPNGQLKIKLDWNRAFIDHLRKNGITGETEEEAIEEYLSRLTTRVSDHQGEMTDFITRDQLEEAFSSINEEIQAETEIAKSQASKAKRRKNRRSLDG